MHFIHQAKLIKSQYYNLIHKQAQQLGYLVYHNTMYLTCVTFSVTLCVRSLTFAAMMVFSEAGGEGTLLSLLVSEKLSAMRGILLIVVYLFKLESEVEPSRLDLRWLKGPDDEK